jgi:4-hydroxy-2-oxoheptanedioate aldolase
MYKNRLKCLLNRGEAVIGPFLKSVDPMIIEICGIAGFDFAIIDCEHGPLWIETAQNMIRAAEARGITPVVRVTENSPELIMRALDIGAHAVQIPQISTADDAKRAVLSAKYYPQGQRGLCRYVRAADYSNMDKAEYFRQANEQSMVIIHIEGIESINNLPEILNVENVDVIFLGPYDLSQSCGVPGDVRNPAVVEKMKRSVELANSKGIAVGTFVDNMEDGYFWMDNGVKYISYSVDSGIFLDASKQIVNEFRNYKNKG